MLPSAGLKGFNTVSAFCQMWSKLMPSSRQCTEGKERGKKRNNWKSNLCTLFACSAQNAPPGQALMLAVCCWVKFQLHVAFIVRGCRNVTCSHQFGPSAVSWGQHIWPLYEWMIAGWIWINTTWVVMINEWKHILWKVQILPRGNKRSLYPQEGEVPLQEELFPCCPQSQQDGRTVQCTAAPWNDPHHPA